MVKLSGTASVSAGPLFADNPDRPEIRTGIQPVITSNARLMRTVPDLNGIVL
jgi:hypothetical protein